MAYTIEQKEEIFKMVFELIENGKSVRAIFNQSDMPNRNTFNDWLNEDKEKSDQYARACDGREEFIFEEILTIADKQDSDVYEVEGIEVTNHNVIQRSRLQIDARKWMLEKMNPKKFGTKTEQTINLNTEQPLFPSE